MKPIRIDIDAVVNEKLLWKVYDNISIETAIKKIKKVEGFMYITKIEPVYFL